MSVGIKVASLGIICLWLGAGCAGSTPPVQDIKIARMALLNAEEAKETQRAAETYRRAGRELSLAQQKMEQKAYDEAKMLAQKATADARLAKIQASNAELEEKIRHLEQELRNLRQEFATIDEGKGE